MSENSTSLVEELNEFINSRLGDLHVSMPARVESYDAATQKVSVTPLIRRGFLDESDTRVTKELPVLTDVPVQFQGAGNFKITFPIAKGDTVLLVFSDFSLERWLADGGTGVDPEDDRRHAISDAVAIPGILSFAEASDQVADGAMVLAGDEVRIGSKDASENVLLGDSYKSAHKTYADAINTAIAGTLAAGPIKSAFLAATNVFKAAADLAISSKVKAE